MLIFKYEWHELKLCVSWIWSEIVLPLLLLHWGISTGNIENIIGTSSYFVVTAIASTWVCNCMKWVDAMKT